MTSWQLAMPAPCRFLSANHRHHWALEAQLVKEWREAAHWHAKRAKLPHLAACHIEATLRFPDRRRRDAGNYAPTLKAVVDGLVDYGLLPDDRHELLTGPDLRIGEPIIRRGGGLRIDGEVVLLITEREALPPAAGDVAGSLERRTAGEQQLPEPASASTT